MLTNISLYESPLVCFILLLSELPSWDLQRRQFTIFVFSVPKFENVWSWSNLVFIVSPGNLQFGTTRYALPIMPHGRILPRQCQHWVFHVCDYLLDGLIQQPNEPSKLYCLPIVSCWHLPSQDWSVCVFDVRRR